MPGAWEKHTPPPLGGGPGERSAAARTHAMPAGASHPKRRMMEDKPRILTNDTATLTPHVSFDPPTLTFDFPGLQIGVAEYAEGPTGCTVFYFPHGGRCPVDIRGGAV